MMVDNTEEELQYEEKMDRIMEQLEDLVLDALIGVLQKLRQRNDSFRRMAEKSLEDMKF